jgi:hypothetical protein
VAGLFADAFLWGFERVEEFCKRGLGEGGKLWKRPVLCVDAVDTAVLSAAVGEKERAIRGGGQGARAEGGVFGGKQLGRGAFAGKGVPDARRFGVGGGEECSVKLGRKVAAADDGGSGAGGGGLFPEAWPVGLFRERLRASIHHGSEVPELAFGIGEKHVAPGGEECAGSLVQSAAKERFHRSAGRLVT